MIYKLRTSYDKPAGRPFAWIALFLALGTSAIFPFFPKYVEGVVGSEEYVSIFYAAMAIILGATALFSGVIFKQYNRTQVTKWCFIFSAFTFLSLVIISSLPALTIINSVRIIARLFVIIALTLYVRDFTRRQNLGREEGVYYRFTNIGFLLGPLIGGFLATNFGYELVFIIAAIAAFGSYVYFHKLHVVDEHPILEKPEKVSLIILKGTVADFFRDADRAKAFAVTVILMMWNAFRNLYIPLYVLDSGYLASMGGIILALGIVPLILLEVKVGEYADKNGVKIPIVWGFLIMGVSLLLVFLSPFVLLNFAILILVNIGAAFVEPVQELYLFKHMPKKEEDRIYGIYMTADPVAYFLTPAIGALILHFLPFSYIFLIFGLITIISALIFQLRVPQKA